MMPVEVLASRLPDLIDELRDAGYTIGVEQYVAAEDLLLTLAARGGLPDDPGRYRTLLGPIFCKSAQEQEDFQARYDRWVAQDMPAPPRDMGRSLERELSDIEQGARTWRKVLVTGSVAALIIAAVAFFALMPPGHLGRPWFSLLMEPRAPAKTLEPGPDPNSLPTQPGPSAGQPIPNPPTPAPSKPRVSLATVLLPTLGLLVAAFLSWKLWWVYRSRLFLARRTMSETPDLAHVSVKGARGELFRDLGLSRMAQKLRHRRTIGSDRLDVPATVLNTVRMAGWLTPVPGKSLVVPEYLVLIDRASHDDHQAWFFAELIDRLVADEVIITRYDFDGDPRICYRAGSAVTVSTIRDLAARHPEHRLLIVSSGTGLIDPLSGELVRWADQFARWPERVLLTPEPTEYWGYPELVLARHGFLVLPATEEGLAALSDAFRARAEDPEPAAPSRASSPLPQLVRERPRRWLERREPAPDLLSELLVELRRYLGKDGYDWLAACAVYPALHWELTLDLGYNLRTTTGLRLLDPKRLTALARLPWFRHGSIPDWLRVALIQSLPRDRERAIRTSLQALLLTASQGRVESFDLEIARQGRDILAPLAKQIFRTLRRQAPDDSPLRDHVFAACMTGRRPSTLALELPLRLGSLIGVRGNPAIPLVLGTLVVVGGLFIVPAHRPPSQLATNEESLFLNWQRHADEKLSSAQITEETLVEVLRGRPLEPLPTPAASLRRDQAIADVLLKYNGVRYLLWKRLGIDDHFLGTGYSNPVNVPDYASASVHEYLIPNLYDDSPQVLTRRLKAFHLAMEKTVGELIEEATEYDIEKQELKKLIIALVQKKDKETVLPPVIRFARFDQRLYSRKLGLDVRTRVFASDLAEIWNLKVKDAANRSGYIFSKGGDTFFVWVFVPTHPEEVVPATWGEILKHIPWWMNEIENKGP